VIRNRPQGLIGEMYVFEGLHNAPFKEPFTELPLPDRILNTVLLFV